MDTTGTRSGRGRYGLPFAVMVLSVLLCGAAAPTTVASASATGAGVSLAEAAPGSAVVDPRPCPDLDGFTCGYLQVPLDRAGGTPGTLRLKVAAADNVDAPRGVLLMLAGGPGQPGVPYVPGMVSALPEVVKQYRLVMIDQRGTGEGATSTPRPTPSRTWTRYAVRLASIHGGSTASRTARTSPSSTA